MSSNEKQPPVDPQPDPQSEDKLVEGYRTMVDRIRTFIDKTEEQSRPKIEEFLELARTKADELGELTLEESQKIADYLRRDLDSAANYLAASEKDIADWLQFDISLIEDWIMDSFLTVADQTRIDLLRLDQQLAAQRVVYHTGEITGPGTFYCDDCGHTLQLKKISRIPPCSKCYKTEFRRQI